MNLLFKTIALTSLFALTTVGLTPCFAAGTEAIAIQSTPAGQTYVGRITRTGANGKKTTGDILLNVTPGTGAVTASVTLQGKSQPFFGTVATAARDTKASPGMGRRRTGTLSRLRLSHVPFADDGFNNQSIRVLQLSVTFTKKQAFGGATTPNGSTLEFTASRIGVAFGNQLPVSMIPLPVTPVGTIPATGDGG